MLTKLWNVAFEPIFKTLKGADMTFKNDFEIENLLIEKLRTVTPTGKVSNTKAYNAMSFYRSLRDIGWKETKQRMSNTAFHRQVKLLLTLASLARHYKTYTLTNAVRSFPLFSLSKLTLTNNYP